MGVEEVLVEWVDEVVVGCEILEACGLKKGIVEGVAGAQDNHVDVL